MDGEVVSAIGPGLLCLIGLRDGDDDAAVDYITNKLLKIRLFENTETGKAWDHSVSGLGVCNNWVSSHWVPSGLGFATPCV